MGFSGRFTRYEVWGKNTVIACLLCLMLIDALPVVPARVRAAFDPIVHGLGIWQTHWALFAPEPDSQNHHVWARLRFADGSSTEWHAPDWRVQSRWQRLCNYRLSTYLDQMREPAYEAARPALADYAAREQVRAEQRSTLPRHVEVRIRDGLIHDARLEPWPPISQRMRLENDWELHSQDYP